jgi:hypothetical protein
MVCFIFFQISSILVKSKCFKTIFFLVPKEILTRVSPEELDAIENSLFTCYAESSTDMPLPSELSLKLTSHQNDYLTELLGSGSIELEATTTVSEFENDEGILQDRVSRWLIMKPSVAQYVSSFGLQLTYECHAKQDSCHEQTMFESIAQNVSLYLNGKSNVY